MIQQLKNLLSVNYRFNFSSTILLKNLFNKIIDALSTQSSSTTFEVDFSSVSTSYTNNLFENVDLLFIQAFNEAGVDVLRDTNVSKTSDTISNPVGFLGKYKFVIGSAALNTMQFEEITYSEITSLISTNSLIQGKTYKITDATHQNGGRGAVIIKALSGSALDQQNAVWETFSLINAFGFITLDGEAGQEITEILINGENQLTSPVTFDTDNNATAEVIAENINNNSNSLVRAVPILRRVVLEWNEATESVNGTSIDIVGNMTFIDNQDIDFGQDIETLFYSCEYSIDDDDIFKLYYSDYRPAIFQGNANVNNVFIVKKETIQDKRNPLYTFPLGVDPSRVQISNNQIQLERWNDFFIDGISIINGNRGFINVDMTKISASALHFGEAYGDSQAGSINFENCLIKGSAIFQAYDIILNNFSNIIFKNIERLSGLAIGLTQVSFDRSANVVFSNITLNNSSARILISRSSISLYNGSKSLNFENITLNSSIQIRYSKLYNSSVDINNTVVNSEIFIDETEFSNSLISITNNLDNILKIERSFIVNYQFPNLPVFDLVWIGVLIKNNLFHFNWNRKNPLNMSDGDKIPIVIIPPSFITTSRVLEVVESATPSASCDVSIGIEDDNETLLLEPTAHTDLVNTINLNDKGVLQPLQGFRTNGWKNIIIKAENANMPNTLFTLKIDGIISEL